MTTEGNEQASWCGSNKFAMFATSGNTEENDTGSLNVQDSRNVKVGDSQEIQNAQAICNNYHPTEESMYNQGVAKAPPSMPIAPKLDGIKNDVTSDSDDDGSSWDFPLKMVLINDDQLTDYIFQALAHVPTFVSALSKIKTNPTNANQISHNLNRTILKFIASNINNHAEKVDTTDLLKSMKLNGYSSKNVDDAIKYISSHLRTSFEECFQGGRVHDRICNVCNTNITRKEDTFSNITCLLTKDRHELSDLIRESLFLNNKIENMYCQTCQTNVSCIERTILSQLPKVLMVSLDRSKKVRYGGRSVAIDNIFLKTNHDVCEKEYIPCSLIEYDRTRNFYNAIVLRDNKWFCVTSRVSICRAKNNELDLQRDEKNSVKYFDHNNRTCIKAILVFLEQKK